MSLLERTGAYTIALQPARSWPPSGTMNVYLLAISAGKFGDHVLGGEGDGVIIHRHDARRIEEPSSPAPGEPVAGPAGAGRCRPRRRQ